MSIVNLNKARKAKARDEKKSRAAANVAAFGRTKAEREGLRKQADKLARALDGHKKER